MSTAQRCHTSPVYAADSACGPAEQGFAADALQPALLRRFGFQARLKPGVGVRQEVRFVEEGQGLPSLWTNLQQQIYLGSDEFIERLQSRLPEEKDVSEVPKVQRRIICSLQWYKQQHSNPKVAMVKAYESGAYTLAQIAGHFRVHYSTVSRAVKQPE